MSEPATLLHPLQHRVPAAALRGALLAGALAVCAVVPPAAASSAEEPPLRALLRSGSSLAVARAEMRHGWAYLDLEDGASIAVPAEHLLRLEPVANSRAPRLESPPVPERAPALGTAAAASPAAPAAQPPAGPAPPATSVSPEMRSLIDRAATEHDLDPILVAAMVRVESNFEPHAISKAGAQGLLQLMPETARRLGVSDPFDPWQNLEGGARYFRSLLDRFEGDIVLALAAYNAGEKAVERHQGLPPFSETRAYVRRVINHFAKGF